MSQIARGSYTAAVTVLQISKPLRIWSSLSRTFARRLRLADQNSSQGNVLRRNPSSVYPEDLSADLLPEIFNLIMTTRAVHSSEYDRTGGHNYYPKCIAELDVLCNLEDLDLIVRFIRPPKQICHCEICLGRYV